MKVAKWNEVTQTPYDIREFGSLKAGNGKAYADMTSYTRLGYYVYMPVQLAEGEGLDNPVWSCDGYSIIQTGTVISAQEMIARYENNEHKLFIDKATSLDSNIIDKYITFYNLYQQTIENIKTANPDIPTDISYHNLVNALLTMDGENWTKSAVALSLLWSDVVVASKLTPAEAFDLLPYMDYRRQNI